MIQGVPAARAASGTHAGPRRGFSLIEVVLVLAIMGLVAGMTLPRLFLNAGRVDAMAQQVRGALMSAQRTAITRQYDVIVSIDTAGGGVRIIEDANNNGTVDSNELPHWRATGRGEGNAFVVPPRGFSAPTVSAPVVGSQLRSVTSFPSIVFHRNGSASSDAEIYMGNAAKGKGAYRCIVVTRSTGRADLYRLSGDGSAAAWILSR